MESPLDQLEELPTPIAFPTEDEVDEARAACTAAWMLLEDSPAKALIYDALVSLSGVESA